MNFIMILGMHRSGTSALTGVLQHAGMASGEVFTQNPHNPRGNREHREVMRINDALLSLNGGSWDSPVLVRRWSVELASARDAYLNELSNLDAATVGFKDPRTLFTLPFWGDAIPQPRIIATFRHPLAVAASLQTRNKFSMDKGLRLWAVYNRRLLQVLEQHPNSPVVCFDQPLEGYLAQVRKSLKQLGFADHNINQGLAFFSDSLRHQSGGADAHFPLSANAQELYAALLKKALA